MNMIIQFDPFDVFSGAYHQMLHVLLLFNKAVPCVIRTSLVIRIIYHALDDMLLQSAAREYMGFIEWTDAYIFR